MKRLTAKIITNGPLTDKEAEVLRLLCEGYYRPEIALKLHRSLSTVSSHVERIADKLDARGSTEIVVLAEKYGLVEIHIQQQSLSMQAFCLVFLAITQLFPGVPKRRPPQSPRPAAVRSVRRELMG